MKNALIEIKDLQKSFMVGEGEIPVLKNISLTINGGEFVIIFGPSGCGKSTLLHCLLGLEKPSSGTVLMEGSDYYSITEDERASYRRHKVGMIYQQPLWIGSLSVIENIAFPLHLLGMEDDEIDSKANAVLKKVGLERWANYRPTELSSGQQQKISLARALMTEPRLIVADEPTGNLDTVSGQELINTFLGLIGEGKTIIMVTHDLEYLKHATHIFHIVDGKLVEDEHVKGKVKTKHLEGKKLIEGENSFSNVRDPDFLKKLHL